MREYRANATSEMTQLELKNGRRVREINVAFDYPYEDPDAPKITEKEDNDAGRSAALRQKSSADRTQNNGITGRK